MCWRCRASAIVSVKAWLAGFGLDPGGAAFVPGVLLVFDVGCDGQGFVFGQGDEPVLVGQNLPGELGWVDTVVDGFQFVALGC